MLKICYPDRQCLPDIIFDFGFVLRINNNDTCNLWTGPTQKTNIMTKESLFLGPLL